MSTDVTFDSDALQAIGDVRNDTNESQYVVCGHVSGHLNQIRLVTAGTDVSELGSKMQSSENLYCLARYKTVIDMSTTIKFVYFVWNGDTVPFVTRGRCGVFKGSISETFAPYHILISTNTPDDMDEEAVMQKLDENAGTKSKVLEDGAGSGGQYQMRGFTQTQLPQRKAKANFGVSDVAKEGADMKVSQDVYNAVSRVRSDADEDTWMVAGYENGNLTGPLICINSGSAESLEELKACLDDASPMYGLYRTVHTDKNDITTVKFIYIQWVGTRVKPSVKGKVSTHKGSAEKIFTPAHISIFATEMSDISEGDIRNQLEKQAAH